MMAIGMQQRVGIAHDADMAGPEEEIAALQIWSTTLYIQRLACVFLLHGGVAQNINTCHVAGQLHQAGSIQPQRAFAAPEIGRADQALR